jgi:DmsE family decaheme c-type cytochrome
MCSKRRAATGSGMPADTRPLATVAALRHWRWMTVLAMTLLAACVSKWPGQEQSGYYRTDQVVSPGQPVGAQLCLDCHGSFDREHHVSSEQHGDCETCHGAGERHAYTTLPQDIRYPSSADCMACHASGHTVVSGWEVSEHARAGLLCSSCHGTHGRELRLLRRTSAIQSAILPRASEVTRMCTSCHSEIAAEFNLPSHHPIAEGMLDCTNCHSPHRSAQETLGSRTDRCATCHQEVMGPWIYEHTPVAEDCGHCHEPHGTSADNLLSTSEPAACIACHTIPTSGAVHDPFAFSTSCSDCHNAVHGSYADPHLRR